MWVKERAAIATSGDHQKIEREPAPSGAFFLRLGLGLGFGLAAMLGAALALWASEGSGVFIHNAFAALAACF